MFDNHDNSIVIYGIYDDQNLNAKSNRIIFKILFQSVNIHATGSRSSRRGPMNLDKSSLTSGHSTAPKKSRRRASHQFSKTTK